MWWEWPLDDLRQFCLKLVKLVFVSCILNGLEYGSLLYLYRLQMLNMLNWQWIFLYWGILASRLLRRLVMNPLQLFSDGNRLLRGDFKLSLLLAHSRRLYSGAPA
jgi:hypothetical protein